MAAGIEPDECFYIQNYRAAYEALKVPSPTFPDLPIARDRSQAARAGKANW